jgi:hypothetical protein
MNKVFYLKKKLINLSFKNRGTVFYEYSHFLYPICIFML